MLVFAADDLHEKQIVACRHIILSINGLSLARWPVPAIAEAVGQAQSWAGNR